MKYIIVTILLLSLSGCGQLGKKKTIGDIVSPIDLSRMAEINLDAIKVGEAYGLRYINNKTGKEEVFDCTKEEYEQVSIHNKQPEKKGYTFKGGFGGSPIYDYSLLKDEEYVKIYDIGDYKDKAMVKPSKLPIQKIEL